MNSVVKTAKSGIWSATQSPSGPVPTFEKKYAGHVDRERSTAWPRAPARSRCTLRWKPWGSAPAMKSSLRPTPTPAPFGRSSPAGPCRCWPTWTANRMAGSRGGRPADHGEHQGDHARAHDGPPWTLGHMAIAAKHGLKVTVRSAAQAHLGPVPGQADRHHRRSRLLQLPDQQDPGLREGGAIAGQQAQLMDKCYTVHNHRHSRRGFTECRPRHR